MPVLARKALQGNFKINCVQCVSELEISGLFQVCIVIHKESFGPEEHLKAYDQYSKLITKQVTLLNITVIRRHLGGRESAIAPPPI